MLRIHYPRKAQDEMVAKAARAAWDAQMAESRRLPWIVRRLDRHLGWIMIVITLLWCKYY